MYFYSLLNFIIYITNCLCLHKFLHIYQLKDYNNKRYFKYFLNKKIIFIILTIIFYIFEILLKNIVFYATINTIFYILNIIFIKNLIKSNKTPVKFTNKLTRLYVISIIILFISSLHKFSFLPVIFLTPFTPIIANFLNIYDKIKNANFIKSAQKKLKNHQTKIIAITGSNGKTSVKNILLKMLSSQYNVQATPASFNTPLGIAKFINNELHYETEFLILEYGARHKNDIKKLCNLFGADYGIITTISGQHLESFHSVENIFKAKSKLPNFLQYKLCVFNIDNLYTLRMFQEKNGEKFSVSVNNTASVYAKNIKIKNCKTHFDLILNNQTYSLKTSLLGRHNVLNICLATALASQLEISTENIISAIENLEQVLHRLSLTQTHINILDDSYNCSPASAKESLWVLKNFPGKKTVVTPGIIECGKEKHIINYNLGKQLAHFDHIVIVGSENKQAMFGGIKKEIEEHNLQPQVLFANSLEESKQYFVKLNSGDTLLLLNDLPDDYN